MAPLASSSHNTTFLELDLNISLKTTETGISFPSGFVIKLWTSCGGQQRSYVFPWTAGSTFSAVNTRFFSTRNIRLCELRDSSYLSVYKWDYCETPHHQTFWECTRWNESPRQSECWSGARKRFSCPKGFERESKLKRERSAAWRERRRKENSERAA